MQWMQVARTQRAFFLFLFLLSQMLSAREFSYIRPHTYCGRKTDRFGEAVLQPTWAWWWVLEVARRAVRCCSCSCCGPSRLASSPAFPAFVESAKDILFFPEELSAHHLYQSSHKGVDVAWPSKLECAGVGKGLSTTIIHGLLRFQPHGPKMRFLIQHLFTVSSNWHKKAKRDLRLPRLLFLEAVSPSVTIFLLVHSPICCAICCNNRKGTLYLLVCETCEGLDILSLNFCSWTLLQLALFEILTRNSCLIHDSSDKLLSCEEGACKKIPPRTDV